MATPSARPRLVPERPFPPYSYLTGRFPHPLRDPQGHSFGHALQRVPPIEPERWADSRDYLAAIDLFNHGYYWEAHEVWESLWHASGRKGRVADFLKGLIKLAAAGVKAREGRPGGVRSHARRAGELFAATRDQHESQVGGGERRFLGLKLSELIATAGKLAGEPVVARRDQSTAVPAVEIVFDFLLLPAVDQPA